MFREFNVYIDSYPHPLNDGVKGVPFSLPSLSLLGVEVFEVQFSESTLGLGCKTIVVPGHLDRPRDMTGQGVRIPRRTVDSEANLKRTAREL